jgi:hypothetical protein
MERCWDRNSVLAMAWPMALLMGRTMEPTTAQTTVLQKELMTVDH